MRLRPPALHRPCDARSVGRASVSAPRSCRGIVPGFTQPGVTCGDPTPLAQSPICLSGIRRDGTSLLLSDGDDSAQMPTLGHGEGCGLEFVGSAGVLRRRALASRVSTGHVVMLLAGLLGALLTLTLLHASNDTTPMLAA